MKGERNKRIEGFFIYRLLRVQAPTSDKKSHQSCRRFPCHWEEARKIFRLLFSQTWLWSSQHPPKPQIYKWKRTTCLTDKTWRIKNKNQNNNNNSNKKTTKNDGMKPTKEAKFCGVWLHKAKLASLGVKWLKPSRPRPWFDYQCQRQFPVPAPFKARPSRHPILHVDSPRRRLVSSVSSTHCPLTRLRS